MVCIDAVDPSLHHVFAKRKEGTSRRRKCPLVWFQSVCWGRNQAPMVSLSPANPITRYLGPFPVPMWLGNNMALGG